MTKQIAGAFLGTLAAGLVLVVGLRVLGPLPLSITQTTTNKQSTFDVSGEGEVATTPDRAEISIGVQINGDSVGQVQEQGNQTIKKITDDVLALGIEKGDIKTVNYSLYPSYDYRTGAQKITGYSLNVNMQIKVKDFSKINQVVDTATRDGANQIGGVNFTLSDDKKRDVENQVREQAIKRAKEKAETLARLAGVRLGKIINVFENATPNGYPYPMMAKEATTLGRPTVDLGAGGDAVPASPTNVEPGSTTFTMTVTLSYETL